MARRGWGGGGRTVAAAVLAVVVGSVAAAGDGGDRQVRRRLARCAPPAIVAQPGSRMVVAGGGTTLEAAAAGTSLHWQWYRGATGDASSPIAGATSSSYATGPLVATASFWVRVANGCGDADSPTAVVTVLGPRTIFLGAGNTVPLELVPIPSGTFAMGSPDSERGRSASEGPRHPVTIARPLYLGRTEVTQAQWQAVTGTNPAHFTWCGGACPVEHVTWNEVAGPRGFLDALRVQQGSTGFRLPTEAEWEYAARAATKTRFPWGDVLECDDGDCTPGACPAHDQHMWWCGAAGTTTFPVAGLFANPWGLFDTSGNVGEWVQDAWHDAYAGAPTDGSAWVGPSGSPRVVRGGGWGGDAAHCRSGTRYGISPDAASDSIGFRLAMDP